MKLPNAHLVTVPEPKVTRYLLNPAHPAGGSKAVFFLRLGYIVGEWADLAPKGLGPGCRAIGRAADPQLLISLDGKVRAGFEPK